MKKTIPNFDIQQVEFEECYINEEYETTTLYFIAPKEWLNGSYPEAVHSEISVEYPTNQPEVKYVMAMLSPTRVDEYGNAEDYDWFDIDLFYSEIEALMNLSMGKDEK